MALIKLSNNGVKNITSVGSASTGDLKFISSSLPNVTYTVTVADSGGNKYFIDGVAQDTISLYRGGTYTFDQSDSSNSGHPLRLSSTSNGTHGGGSEYTTGVTTTGTAGSSGAKTVIVVPQDAPTLYYYCTNHSGMGGTANISGVSNISFTSGIDSTYMEYVFYFNNLHFSDNACNFEINFRDGGSNYDATKTSTFFRTQHDEADTTTDLSYQTGRDLAQSTGNQTLAENLGNANDESLSGHLTIFNPASTTFVKHFLAQTQYYQTNNYSESVFVAGYCNVTVAIDGVKFVPSAGTIDSGDILLYGVN